MNIGDCSHRIRAYQIGETVDIVELEEEFRRIDRLMIDHEMSGTKQAFYKLYYFLLHQVFMGDILVTSIPDAKKLSTQFLRLDPKVSVNIEDGFEADRQITVIRREPVRNRKFFIEAEQQSVGSLANFHAAGVCFVAFDRSDLFFENCDKFRAATLRKQKFGFLQILASKDIDLWIATCHSLFEPFNVCFWMSDCGGPAEESVVTITLWSPLR